MENKFKFLTKYSLSRKLKNKWFLIANVIVAVVIICLINIDHIIGFFGGDFNKPLTINIKDNTGYYETIKNGLSSIEKYLPDSKIKIKKVTNIKETKKKIKDTKNIILVINKDANIFKVDIISDDYIDKVKYQSIISTLNAVKNIIALEDLGIDEEKLKEVNEEIKVNRMFLDKSKTKNEESSRTL